MYAYRPKLITLSYKLRTVPSHGFGLRPEIFIAFRFDVIVRAGVHFVRLHACDRMFGPWCVFMLTGLHLCALVWLHPSMSMFLSVCVPACLCFHACMLARLRA